MCGKVIQGTTPDQFQVSSEVRTQAKSTAIVQTRTGKCEWMDGADVTVVLEALNSKDNTVVW
jgi:hypothetical protein